MTVHVRVPSGSCSGVPGLAPYNDTMASLTKTPVSPGTAGKHGYRAVASDYSEQNFTYDMRFAGPYLGLGFSW